MVDNTTKSSPAIGFLTVASIPGQGLVGGFLVLNTAARPLEFHCTAPVKPNRAQEILYGPTLRPYLCGEQIGQTLLDRSNARPLVTFTDTPDVLAARREGSLPIVLVLKDDDGGASDSEKHNDVVSISDSNKSMRGVHAFSLGPLRVAVGEGFSQDQTVITEQWNQQLRQMDLHEPFDRIHEAIKETQVSK